MRRIEAENKIHATVLTGLCMCLILVTTSLFKMPNPFTQGYVHLGDAMVFLGVLMLGRKNGAIAAGFGSALGDLLGGFAVWAPFTFLIKFLMAQIMGLFVEALEKRGAKSYGSHGFTAIEVIGMILAGIEMCGGYVLSERILYGSWSVAFLGIPWNIGQFVVGIVVAVVISEALYQTPMRKYFAIR